MRTKLCITAIALLLALASGSAPLTAFAGGGSCGVPPIPPIPPIGCKRMDPQCQCDSRGQNCHWVMVCVKG